MEVAQVLHMNKGSGDTSYAKNSTVQSKIISIAKPVIEEAILKCLEESLPESMGIADLGCSSGPNTLIVMSDIIQAIHAKCCSLGRSSPELTLFLNDLFNNDFNNIFASLPAFYNRIREDSSIRFNRSCFISGVPGSFYGRLFARNSLHFVHSSSSLHWLSQVPPGLESNARTVLNKGKIYISKSSPQCVLDAYSKQFQEDFFLFLRSRSEEIVVGGRMVLSFMGRNSSDPTTEDSCYQWELLALALMTLASESLIKEENVDNFNAPYYAPCPEELKLEVEKEGSFIVERLEALPIDWDGGSTEEYCVYDTLEALYKARGQRVAKSIRAVVESMLEAHFGKEIMDDLFRRYQDLVSNYFATSSTKYINLVISLMKRE
ncbi:Jasmonate O-methyltransferase [Morus notabilis]|uniref:Jasmonate O-methyltransferase n=1 Tax=Morus notabilis TaxID=981085 RepID=W9SC22_9ROSA|nr:jasmonate O-methyltransferase [Morus notabilis]XP_024030302.1 jasmonate O-methyltransferase [Morus notabilis]EXC25060.1 Jasmonate O-methyltransferase [Morus notabilis]